MNNDLISRDDLINAKPEFRNEKVVRDTKYRTAKDRIYAKAWNACNSYWLNTIKNASTVKEQQTEEAKEDMRLIDADKLKKSLNYIYDCAYIESRSKEGIASDIIDKIDQAPTVVNEMNNDMLPVGTTIKIKSEDIKWDSGDLISREALRNVILNDSKLDGVNANWEVNRILVHIENAPTASDRYYEGYAQGYIHGSTGADWQGE